MIIHFETFYKSSFSCNFPVIFKVIDNKIFWWIILCDLLLINQIFKILLILIYQSINLTVHVVIEISWSPDKIAFSIKCLIFWNFFPIFFQLHGSSQYIMTVTWKYTKIFLNFLFWKWINIKFDDLMVIYLFIYYRYILLFFKLYRCDWRSYI
jgi:hypothetical protein